MPRPQLRPSKKSKQPPPLMPGGMFLLALMLLAVLAAYYMFPIAVGQTIRYDQFVQLLVSKQLSRITLIGNDRVQGELKEEARQNPDDFVKKLRIPSNGKFTVRLVPA